MAVETAPIVGDCNPYTPFGIAQRMRRLGAQSWHQHGSHAAVLCAWGARLARVPVIATDTGGTREACANPAVGRLVPVGAAALDAACAYMQAPPFASKLMALPPSTRRLSAHPARWPSRVSVHAVDR